MPGLQRHPALQDLSRDHQLVLLHAREIRWTVEGDRRAQPWAAVAREFLRFWQREGILHLQEEEEVLLPAYGRRVPLHGDETVRHVLADHAWLHQATGELQYCLQSGREDAVLLGTIGRKLHDHVRLEERLLFQSIQAVLSEEELDHLGALSIAFRLRWRGLAAIGPLETRGEAS